jgi:hypothetical protein
MRAFSGVIACVAALLLNPVASLADDPAKPDDLRQKRLETLLSRLDQLKMEVLKPEAPAKNAVALQRGKQPILRWSNPVRDFVNDGLIFLFLEGERPRCVVTAWARSPEASLESGEIWCEFISLSAEPLACRRDGRDLWTPKTGGLTEQSLAGAPPPAERPAQRLVQMRDLARRFQATSYKMDDPNELRLLTQPLYRYQSDPAGILDGALFSFAEGNDPEALLLLEAVRGEAGQPASWRYTLARATSYRVSIRLGDREVFTALPYWKNPRTPSDAYHEINDGPFTLGSR